MFNNIKYNVMKIINYSFKNKPSILLVIIGVILTSCGSYQYVGQTNDGIYETSESEVIITDNESNDNYYTNYFRDKALEVENLNTEESDIFTDIDTYQSTYTDSTNVKQNAGWGETNNQVVVNLYNDVYTDQLYRYGWGNWTDVYFYNYGWNNWRWNRWNRWNSWGWNSWGWNNWGWNAGFYDPFWYGGFYGYAYHPAYYGYSPYYNGIYSRRGISYNAGRRGTMTRTNSMLNGRSSSRILNNNATRPSRSTSVRPRTNTSVRPRSNNSTVRPSNSTVKPRSNSTVRPRTNSTGRPRTNNSVKPRTSTPRNNNYSTPRTNSSSRSFGGSSRSSSRGGRRG